MKALTREQADFFHHNGFLFPIPALTRTEIQTCLDGLARLEAELGGPVADADPKWRSHGHYHAPWLADLARHPKILDAVEDVIGPDILVWTSTFFIKEPGSATYAAWHQDGGYFGMEPNVSVCAWVALTDASREAGCMEQLSFHGRPRLYHHAPKGLPNSINRAGQTIVEPFDEADPTAMALQAGSFSLHHELAIHRSAPNHAAHRRVGIGINYVPPHARVDSDVRCLAMLARGQDRYGHFELVEPGGGERDAAALALHQTATDRYRANYRIQVDRHAARFARAAE
ncbi:phytanoyl-CoA dioxygenase family protein [Rhodopila sp.]|uniref:phytanoyl-CoA dioxygenase family protein n=1 Tax=Rhodopila sp. TaxID=2480087 RepID=UPI002BC00ABB|nr:phytanoyl-CoA dioxygenase family protein [Rhodopila sp.]HVZ10544.1 phytanoyl-CoA dioxygenase family protein [Rhodopila sp.]